MKRLSEVKLYTHPPNYVNGGHSLQMFERIIKYLGAGSSVDEPSQCPSSIWSCVLCSCGSVLNSKRKNIILSAYAKYKPLYHLTNEVNLSDNNRAQSQSVNKCNILCDEQD